MSTHGNGIGSVLFVPGDSLAFFLLLLLLRCVQNYTVWNRNTPSMKIIAHTSCLSSAQQRLLCEIKRNHSIYFCIFVALNSVRRKSIRLNEYKSMKFAWWNHHRKKLSWARHGYLLCYRQCNCWIAHLYAVHFSPIKIPGTVWCNCNCTTGK